MNEFLEQFLVEAREYVEQAGNDLLALERNVDNREALDSAFRAFHTLKGGAGIIDFDVMEAFLHRAEDRLAASRSGEAPLDRQTIDHCMAALDQVSAWLDEIQGSGALPPEAAAQADAFWQRFAEAPIEGRMPSTDADEARVDWSEALIGRHDAVRSTATTAIRYTPHAESFFEQEDPLARFASLPGLVALDIEPLAPWPALEAMDPYVCGVRLLGLAADAGQDVVRAFEGQEDLCEIVSFDRHAASDAQRSLAPLGRRLVDAQLELLRNLPETARRAGCLRSAAAVCAHVLAREGRSDAAAALRTAMEAALQADDPGGLIAAIEATWQPPETIAVEAGPAAAGALPRTVRVDARRVDHLVRLAGELTVTKNAIGHIAKRASDEDADVARLLQRSHDTLQGLVGELQHAVMGMRVLPLRHAFQRFPRLVREMGQASGKPAELVVEGEDTEADKTIVEMLFEPLLHVIRNALDHGIEDAAQRRERGKPERGTIVLSAQRRGDQVVVEVRDDGGGIDIPRVRDVAIQRGVLDAGTANQLSDERVADLIFEPGFSTAASVSNVSGRGVGMDAVRAAVRRVGGQVNVVSAARTGTTVRFSLPFTIMMTQVLTVTAGAQIFGIPIDSIAETLQIDAASIVPVGPAHAMVLRNSTLPVISLADALNLDGAVAASRHATMVVVASQGRLGVLRVDAIGERLDILLKPLEGLLSGMPGIAGSTVLGDGSVLLVLDVSELFT